LHWRDSLPLPSSARQRARTWSPGGPNRDVDAEQTTGSLTFLSNPHVPMPRSTTPDCLIRLAKTTIQHGPRSHHNEDASHNFLSRLYHAALALAVYASQGRSPLTTQDSLPAAGQALPGRIGYLLGCYERFRIMSSVTYSSSFLKLRDARWLKTIWYNGPIAGTLSTVGLRVSGCARPNSGEFCPQSEQKRGQKGARFGQKSRLSRRRPSR